MSENEDQSKVPQSTKYAALGILAQNPLAANPSKDSCFDFIGFLLLFFLR
jgi:hypothetical protein